MTNNLEQPKPKPKHGTRKLTRHDDLTIKQNAFAEKLAAGVHFNEAWRSVYNCENLNERSAYQKSWKDARHPKILKRVAELKDQIQKATDARLAGHDLPSNTLPVVREATRLKSTRLNALWSPVKPSRTCYWPIEC